jgi:hypothetical protein
MDFASIVANWKTTIAGLGAIFVSLGDLFNQVASGNAASGNVKTDAGIILAGIIGLMAKDHNAVTPSK